MIDAKNAITTVGLNDMSVLMNPGTAKRQPMRGFDPDYVDIVDYIVRCTHKIWDERNVGLIYSHYRHNSIVHSPYGTIVGRDAMVTNTIQRMAAFPDRRPFAEDVVWCGDDQTGFYSAHRVCGVGTNTGYSQYGPPTGRKITARGMADCMVFENRIYEEWVLRDEASVAMQLGFEVNDVVRDLAQRGVLQNHPAVLPPIERVQGQLTPEPLTELPTDHFECEAFIRRALDEVWNWRMFGSINHFYAPGYCGEVPPGRTLRTRDELFHEVINILQCFPDARLNIEHYCALQDSASEHRVAIRWRLEGTHEGFGRYGKPTGKRMSTLGVSHYLVRGGQIAQEWTVWDDIALRLQIYA